MARVVGRRGRMTGIICRQRSMTSIKRSSSRTSSVISSRIRR